MAYYTNNATFDGQAFFEAYDGGLGAPVGDTLLEYAAYHVPGGDTTVILSAGQIAQTVDIPFVADAIVLQTLQGKVGTTGTLDYSGGSGVTATLLGVLGARKEQGGPYRGTLRVITAS
ncbi:MAG TPA: hypothetical protein PKK15_22070 [Kouleothrix sp.]|nr:hypothetical protein [Kouleothrix sp.]